MHLKTFSEQWTFNCVKTALLDQGEQLYNVQGNQHLGRMLARLPRDAAGPASS